MDDIAQKQTTSAARRRRTTDAEEHQVRINGWNVIIEAIRASNRWPAWMQFAIFIVGAVVFMVCVWRIGVVETAAGGAAMSGVRQVAGRVAKK